MAQQYPQHYKSTISRTVPAGGTADPAAAEQLLLSSIGTSLLATFEAIAARDGIELLWWQATVSAQVEQTPEGPQLTSILAAIDMQIDGNIDAIEATLENTRKYALVTNALRVPVIVEATIFDREHRQAG